MRVGRGLAGDRLRAWFVPSALAVLLAVRVIVSLHRIDLPGLQYDETLFVNAATLRQPGVFIQHSWHGIPLMVFPYIGALKSWIYAPVFSVFGTSPGAIRIPVILITTAGVLLVFLAVRDLLGTAVSLLATAALAFDNSVLWLTRDDVGPSALEFFLKALVLFCVTQWARTRRTPWVMALGAALALGVFNKLNFIWVVNAAVLCSLVVAIVHRERLRAHRRSAFAWIGCLIVIYGAFGAYYFVNHIGSTTGGSGGFSLEHLPQWIEGTRAVLSGTWFYSYALAPLEPRNAVIWIIVALFAAGTVSALWQRRLGLGCLALTTLAIAVQNIVTPQATAGWHFLAIFPFVTIVTAAGAEALARLLIRRRAAVVAAVAALGVGAVVYDGLLIGKYDRALGGPTSNVAWSPAIYQLSEYFQHHPGEVVTVDWGIQDPLFALHPSPRWVEMAFALNTPTPAAIASARASLLSGRGEVFVVTHPDPRLAFPSAGPDLHRAAHGLLRLRTVISDHGVPVFDIYDLRTKPAPAR